MQLNEDLLRGVDLHQTLRQCGWMWRQKPKGMGSSSGARVYAYSYKTDRLDMFISHAWQSPSWQKILSLLIHSGWRFMLKVWAASVSLSILLCLLDILPDFYSIEIAIMDFEGTISLSTWVAITGLVSVLGAFLASPYFARRNLVCFMDIACIHQTDEALMQQGIYNLAGCLSVSANLHVLWAAPVFSRLWCVFELAAYRKLNPRGQVTITPLYLGVVFSEIFLLLHAVGFAWVFVRMFSFRLNLVVVTCVCTCLLPVAHSYRHNILYRQQLLSSLETFNVKDAECSNDFDREYIHTAITALYGSLDAFSMYVRGPFRQEVSVPLHPPLGSMMLLTTAMNSVSLDYLVGLLKARAPTQSVMAFIVSILIGFNLLWLPATGLCLIFACERLPPAPAFRGSQFLQSLLIFCGLWLAIGTGLVCSSGGYASGRSWWTILAWLLGSCRTKIYIFMDTWVQYQFKKIFF